MVYPAMLDIANRPCLVVGGGKVAERKIRSLLDAHASVTVVSPQITDVIRSWRDKGQLSLFLRNYQQGDADGAVLVFAATDHADINRQVAEDCRGTWVNVADSPELSTFTVPSSFQKGLLRVAVSTSGASPAYAAALCRQLEEQVGEDIERYLDMLETYRNLVKQTITDAHRRSTLLRDIVKLEPQQLLLDGLQPYLEALKEEAE